MTKKSKKTSKSKAAENMDTSKELNEFLDEELKYTDYNHKNMPAGLRVALMAKWEVKHTLPKIEETK